MPCKKIFLLLITVLTSFGVQGQNTKGMYIDGFKNIIGNTEKEDELLCYAQEEGFNYLLLYNLTAVHRQHYDLTEWESAQVLASFIERAKTEYGINEVGAVGEKFSSFEKIISYNQLYKGEPNKQFDILNIEFEFWNKHLYENYYCEKYLQPRGLPCTTDGAFEYYIKQLKKTAKVGKKNGLKTETYIGSPKPTHCKAIGATCDRVLVHFYRKSDTYKNGNSLFNCKTERLKHLAPHKGTLKVLPIFAANDKFMADWLNSHPADQVFETYMNGQAGYNSCEEDWKDHISIDGFQWYAYSYLTLND